VDVRACERGERQPKPCAIATPSLMLRSCSTSGRVGGTTSASVSSSVAILVVSDMRESSAACAVPESAMPVQLLMYAVRPVACVSSGPA
jgi:hypothetical protein